MILSFLCTRVWKPSWKKSKVDNPLIPHHFNFARIKNDDPRRQNETQEILSNISVYSIMNTIAMIDVVSSNPHARSRILQILENEVRGPLLKSTEWLDILAEDNK